MSISLEAVEQQVDDFSLPFAHFDRFLLEMPPERIFGENARCQSVCFGNGAAQAVEKPDEPLRDIEVAFLCRFKNPENYFRQVLFLCDEYQHFATVGESEPTGDEKFFSLSRQPKCIPITATQSISSLKSALPRESWRTLLQTFRTKISLSLSDDFSARTATELCGREDRLKASYNLSESGHDARVSLLTGKAMSHKANITASKSYSPQHDLCFDVKDFMELRNAQSVTIAYDGTNPMPPMFCYLKPYYNNVNKSYFRQLADGEL